MKDNWVEWVERYLADRWSMVRAEQPGLLHVCSLVEGRHVHHYALLDEAAKLVVVASEVTPRCAPDWLQVAEQMAVCVQQESREWMDISDEHLWIAQTCELADLLDEEARAMALLDEAFLGNMKLMSRLYRRTRDMMRLFGLEAEAAAVPMATGWLNARGWKN